MKPETQTPSAVASTDRRLDSWKEIANFYGRDERTVKRWEKLRGLPVHRVPGPGRSSIFAWQSELAQWLAGNELGAADAREPEQISESKDDWQQPPAIEPLGLVTPRPQRGSMGRPAIFAAVVVLAATGAYFFSHFRVPVLLATTPPLHRAAHVPPRPAEDLYLKGMYTFNKRTPESLNQAVDSFNQAIALDPNYAAAYSGLADSYNLLREYSLMPPEQAYPLALAAAQRAVQLDPDLPNAHTSLAFVDFYWSWDIPAALREFDLALKLDPNSVQARHWYANVLLCLKRYPEALQQIEVARKLDPASRNILADDGLILFVSGRDQEAIASLQQLEAAEPRFLSPHNYLAAIFLARGDYPKYLSQARQAATLLHDSRQLTVLDAAQQGFAHGGKDEMFVRMIQQQRTFFAEGQQSAYSLAQTSALALDKKQALDYLRKAYDRREAEVVGMLWDPALTNLHGEPAYRELLSRLAIPVQTLP